MKGEDNLQVLLQTMKPKLHTGDYVFCTVKELGGIDPAEIILLFREDEGLTLVLEKSKADSLQLSYTFIAAWISLTVHSSLEAVGLTAAFSKALADEGISCNVVAGYFHDHIFVDHKQAGSAMAVLNRFSAA